MTALRLTPAFVTGLLAVAPSCIDWQSGSDQRSSGGAAEDEPDGPRDDVAQPAERAADWDDERGGAGGVHEPVEVAPHGGGAGGEDGPVQLVGSGGSGGGDSASSSSSSAASSSSSVASSSASGSGGGAVCAHALCQTGALLAAACDPCVAQICQQDPYCCQTGWDSVCVGEVGSICGAPCTPPTGSCAHSICTIGGLLQSGCDPCVTAICQQDPYCCQTSWDGQCVNEVKTICGSAACG